MLELDGIGETQTSSIENFFLNKTNLKITYNLIQELEIKILLPTREMEFFLIKKLCLLEVLKI